MCNSAQTPCILSAKVLVLILISAYSEHKLVHHLVPMKPHSAHPTILFTEAASHANAPLAGQLRQAGYLVLESHDDAEALELARVHSRPIHVMVAAEGEK